RYRWIIAWSMAQSARRSPTSSSSNSRTRRRCLSRSWGFPAARSPAARKRQPVRRKSLSPEHQRVSFLQRTPRVRAGGTHVTLDVAPAEGKAKTWSHRHLLGLEDLSRSEIETILDLAEDFVVFSQLPGEKRTELKGKVVVNLFFESSTRTRTSFSL